MGVGGAIEVAYDDGRVLALGGIAADALEGVFEVLGVAAIERRIGVSVDEGEGLTVPIYLGGHVRSAQLGVDMNGGLGEGEFRKEKETSIFVSGMGFGVRELAVQ